MLHEDREGRCRRHFRRAREAKTAPRWLPIVIGLATLASCASREMVLEVQGSILHDKPGISSVTHSVADGRQDGGTVVVSVRMLADPGLTASFDISPGIVERKDLPETSAGEYEAEFALPVDLVGGPFTIIARVRHAEAGEVTAKDPVPLTISLPR